MRISRAKLAFCASSITIGLAINLWFEPVLAARFVDTSGYWGEKYVNKLSDRGVLPASDDGKFDPDKPITRGELAEWLVKTLKLDKQPISGVPSFPDVKPTDPNFRAIEIIRQNNYISGYKDGFRPKQFIQRGEMISIVARALNRPEPQADDIEKILAPYKDHASVPQMARSGVAKAIEGRILITQSADEIKPIDMATRGDTAVLLCALADSLERRDIAMAAESTAGTPNSGSSPQQGMPPPLGFQGNPTGYPQMPRGAYGGPPQYQGQVERQDAYNQPPQQPPGYGPPPGMQPPGAYVQQGAANFQPPFQGQYQGGQPGYPGQQPMLTGRVATVAAGTMVGATLKNTINSGSSQPGEAIEASIDQPLYSNGQEVIPAGSRLIGQITNVVSARRFKFGANGQVNIKFTQLVTPSGKRFPLSASIDTNQVKLTGGTTAGRVGKGALTTAVGAGSGAALGTALGAIVGGTSDGRVGKATGMGAVFGTAIGGGIGLVGAGVRKGSEVKITAGSNLPIRIDQTLQVTTDGAPPGPPPYGQPPPGYPNGAYY